MLFFFYLTLIINYFSFYQIYGDQVKTKLSGSEFLLCRKCGADIADSSYIFNKLSPGSQKIEKQNLFGKQNVTIQTLVNPYGMTFDVVTIEKAKCVNLGPKQGADSWFPGYTWRFCACPHCGHHLGWTFEIIDSSNIKEENHTQSFHGLILNSILGENFTDSLIMLPKTLM